MAVSAVVGMVVGWYEDGMFVRWIDANENGVGGLFIMVACLFLGG